MANFPTSLDALPDPIDPSAGQYLWQDGSIRDGIGPTAKILVPANPALVHETQHANVNSAVRALQVKVGINNSSVPTSIDYLLRNSASVDPGHRHGIGSGGTGATDADGAFYNLISNASDITFSDPSLTYLGVLDADGNQGGRITIDYAFGVWFTAFGAQNNQLLYYFNGAPFGLPNGGVGTLLQSNGATQLPSFVNFPQNDIAILTLGDAL